MLAELGQIALILALLISVSQAWLGFAGATRGRLDWMQVLPMVVMGQLVFTLLAYLLLSWAFVVNDFSIAYVANNSNTDLPLIYRLTAVWGAHEGSLILWCMLMALWTVAAVWFSRNLPRVFTSRAIGILGVISAGFILFTLLTSNPFERIFPIPEQGRDLNPILQDPAMILHPPMLYLGYLGLSIPFAFAVSSLIGLESNTTWARWTRPWATIAWVCLTIGIALGSWWAYYELGWGGWWFWDPVENASFMPWLVATALIHSLAVTEKRGAFRNWTVLLAISAFALALLGAFLVRSGVLVSVHAFATDPTRGVYILIFLAAVVGGSLALYAWRAPHMASGGGFKLLSRETFLLLNNLLLVVATAAVLLGTLYPLFLDALGLGKISVGPPYFNAVFIPLMLPLLLFLGFGPYARWKRQDGLGLGNRMWPVMAAAVVLGVGGTLLLAGPTGVMVLLGMVLALWVVLSVLVEPISRFRKRGMKGITGMPVSLWGMLIAHAGVGLLALGVVGVTTWSVERDLRMAPGDSYEVAGYTFKFDGVRSLEGPNWDSVQGQFIVTRNGREVTRMYPENRVYRARPDPLAQIALHPRLRRDLYVAMGDYLGDDYWSVRIHYKAMVRFIWLGALVMSLGGLLAVFDRRYRIRRQPRQEEQG
ncbi:cytochrome c-type biogenesis protein CcmF [Natronospira proteinivora]|uniref:Cytochrome c-type biogenesis protein CcmF n=1 Tax=Natronospira proteinivora TaxID=1807133 RepID=A0ABT1G6A1_9GAMM|nr:heme lyase CcmF/NrfE family subunit [Natronospira proteinivora]MCP1726823.1 cytochrome c-type biogenesis protein CcmF [Natronospira proteinivora]